MKNPNIDPTPFDWLIALPLVLFLSALGIALDAEDNGAEFQQSTALIAAQKHGEAIARREAAGLELCREKHGEALPRWTEAGELVCVSRKGQKVAAL